MNMKKLWVYAAAMSLCSACAPARKTATPAPTPAPALAPAAAAAPKAAPATAAATTRNAVVSGRADVPAPKIDAATGKINKAFAQKHEKYVDRAKQGGIDLLFEGDSITEGWMGKNGKDVWKQRYLDKYGEKVANFGISGDRTQHVLWRNEHGELENIHPKVVVLMIGTNNAGSNPPDEIARGIEKIVKQNRDIGAKVLLLSVFPRGADNNDPKRQSNAQVNEQIKKLDDGTNVRYFELWNQFLGKDGTLSRDIMPDLLHPNAKGYEIWADAMQPLLDEMLGGSGSGGSGENGK